MLDASVRAQILAVLIELQRRRDLALIFITHDLSLAWSLCDRIAVMYLGRIVEQGSAVDVIEQPRHPYTQALVTAIPVPPAGGGGKRELLGGELPDATDLPSGCRFHPRCPRRFEPCDRVDPELLRRRAARPARGLPAARRVARGRPRPAQPMAERGRWRELVGPVGRLEPGPANAITDVPGVLVGHSQASSGEPTGVTVVAPPSLPAPAGDRGRQRHGRAHREDRDRRAGDDVDTRVPLRLARRRRRPPRGGARLRPRPRRDRAAGRRRVRRQLEGRLPQGRHRRRRPGDRERWGRRWPRAASARARA